MLNLIPSRVDSSFVIISAKHRLCTEASHSQDSQTDRLSSSEEVLRKIPVLTKAGIQTNVLLIRTFQRSGERWLLPLNCATKGRRNCVVLSGPHRGSFTRISKTHLDSVDEEDLKRGLTEWEDKQRIRRQGSAYTEAQEPSEVSRVPVTESRRGPLEEAHVVPSQRKLPPRHGPKDYNERNVDERTIGVCDKD